MSADSPIRSPRRFIIVCGAVAVPTAMLLTFLVGCGDNRLIHNKAELGAVPLGRPFAWWTWNLGSLDPPYPYREGPGNPMDDPFTVHPGLFLADTVVYWACLMALIGIVAAFWWRRASQDLAPD